METASSAPKRVKLDGMHIPVHGHSRGVGHGPAAESGSSDSELPRRVIAPVRLPPIGKQSVGKAFPETHEQTSVTIATAVTSGAVTEAQLEDLEAEVNARDRLAGEGVMALLRRVRDASQRVPQRAEATLRMLLSSYHGDADCARATLTWAESLGMRDTEGGPDSASSTSGAGLRALQTVLHERYGADKDSELFLRVSESSEEYARIENSVIQPLVRAPHWHVPLLQLAESLHSASGVGGGVYGFLDLLIDKLGVEGGGHLALWSSRPLAAEAYAASLFTSLQAASLPNRGPDTALACTAAARALLRNAIAPSVLLGELSAARIVAARLAGRARAHPHVTARVAAALRPLVTGVDAVVGSGGCVSARAAGATASASAAVFDSLRSSVSSSSGVLSGIQPAAGFPPHLSVALMEAAAEAVSAPFRAASLLDAVLSPTQEGALQLLRFAVGHCAACLTVALPGEGDPRLVHPSAGGDSAVVARGAARLATVGGVSGEGESSAAEPADAGRRSSVSLRAPVDLEEDFVGGTVLSAHSGVHKGRGGEAPDHTARALGVPFAMPPSRASSSSSTANAFGEVISDEELDGAWVSTAHARAEGGLDAVAAAGASPGRLPVPARQALQMVCWAIDVVEEQEPPLEPQADEAVPAGPSSEQLPAADAMRHPAPSASPPSTFRPPTPDDADRTDAPRRTVKLHPFTATAAAMTRLAPLTERLLALLFHPSAPAVTRHTAAFATRILAFASAPPDVRADVAQQLLESSSLCRAAEAGLAAEGMPARLAIAAAAHPVVAGGILVWCRGLVGSSLLSGRAVFRGEMGVLLKLASKIAELQPKLANRALVVLRRALRVHREGVDAEEPHWLQCEALSATVRTMAVAGAALPALDMVWREITDHHLDASVARSFVVLLLETAGPGYTRKFAEGVLLVLQALASRGGHESLGDTAKHRAVALARWCLMAFQGRADLSAKDQASKELASRVEAAYM
jgi:hypothetical protein